MIVQIVMNDSIDCCGTDEEEEEEDEEEEEEEEEDEEDGEEKESFSFVSLRVCCLYKGTRDRTTWRM